MTEPKPIRNVLNFVSFNVGWWSCALGAGKGAPWVGPAVVAALIVAHVIATQRRAPEIALIAVAGLAGSIIDTFLGAAGVFSFARDPIAPITPPFMIALWLNFSTTPNFSLAFLKGRPLLAALLGAAGGPMTYYGGQRLGAIDLNDNLAFSLGVIAVEWALVTPAMFWLAGYLRKR